MLRGNASTAMKFKKCGRMPFLHRSHTPIKRRETEQELVNSRWRPESRGVPVKKIVERVVDAFSPKHSQAASELERTVYDEISDFVAELLAKRADQLARFGNTEPRA
jgi:diadenosine tetraphosphatase ApaH/serine/threonine PP2A family protein phosphatase